MELPTPALEVLRDEFERMATSGPVRGKQMIDDAKLRKGGKFAPYDDLKPDRDYDTH